MKLRKVISLFLLSVPLSASCNSLIYAWQNSKASIKENKGDMLMNGFKKASSYIRNFDGIESNEISISKLCDCDAEILLEYLTDEEVTKYAVNRMILKSDAHQEDMLKILKNGNNENHLLFAIKNRENIPVGIFEFECLENENMVSCCYCVGKPFWGNEQIEEVISLLLSKLCEFNVDVMIEDYKTEQSQRIFEKTFKLLNQKGINYVAEKGCTDWTIEVAPIENSENASIKYFQEKTEIIGLVNKKTNIKWHVLTDNKLEVKIPNYKFKTNRRRN